MAITRYEQQQIKSAKSASPVLGNPANRNRAADWSRA